MSEHVGEWLGAYADGELPSARVQQVEDHLAACAECREALAELRVLRSLLMASYPEVAPTPPERFVAQVAQRLSPQPARSGWRRVLLAGWRLAPLGLLATWAYGEAVLLVSGLLLAGLRVVPGGAALLDGPVGTQGSGWGALLSGWVGGSAGEVLRSATRIYGAVEGFGTLVVLNVLWLALVAVLYSSWMASWWARRHSRALAEARLSS